MCSRHGVRTSHGLVSCQTVVLAPGPWRNVYSALPLAPLKGEILRLRKQGPPPHATVPRIAAPTPASALSRPPRRCLPAASQRGEQAACGTVGRAAAHTWLGIPAFLWCVASASATLGGHLCRRCARRSLRAQDRDRAGDGAHRPLHAVFAVAPNYAVFLLACAIWARRAPRPAPRRRPTPRTPPRRA